MTEALGILPFILFLVVIGTAIAERINVPYPLVLVIAGLIVGFTPGIPDWHPSSETVLPLFLPPILFAAARLVSWEDIKSNFGSIISLAIILVLLTAIAVAYALHWVMPEIAISTAFILGAIISPTDAIAATSILSKMKTGKEVIRTLEVESLFNDAVSIVIYQAAVMFAFLGEIDFHAITLHPIIIGAGGIAVGFVFAYSTSLITKEFLTDSENELPIIMGLILAYVSYLFADHIGVSGVMAVVTAGLYHKKTEQAIKARTRLSKTVVWDTLVFFMNGLIFTVIGMQFPNYLEKVSFIPTSRLFLYSTITIGSMILLRLIWITITQSVAYLFYKIIRSEKNHPTLSWKNILILSWSGMRGLVSLALALALPLTITNMNVFPYRELIIFLTMISILFTLMVQGLTLPLLIKWLGVEENGDPIAKETVKVYRKLTKQVIEYINELEPKEHPCEKAAKRIIDNYYEGRVLQFRISQAVECDQHNVDEEAEKLLSKVLEYERRLLHSMRRKHEISEEIYLRIRQKIDRDEVGFAIDHD